MTLNYVFFNELIHYYNCISFILFRSEEASSLHRLQAATVAIKYMSRVSPEVISYCLSQFAVNGCGDGCGVSGC